ncbi:MAG: hypothetical protein H6R23_2858, partial [Proteobacteria bacterium]|nr:hypothetical protein [Pseudomonadota bacterium]
MNRELSLPELKSLLVETLAPERILLRRAHAGAIDLRILSHRFAECDEPLMLVQEELAKRGVTLPERTLTLLKAPEELEEGEEESLFSQPLLGAPTWADALALEPEVEPRDDRGLPAGVKIVAFWGLKGGVGRSTALSHVALLLGRRQVRVLAVDLDLESPALASALSGFNARSDRPRFDDLIRRLEMGDTEESEMRRLM